MSNFNDLNFNERQAVYKKQQDLFDEEFVWEQAWRNERRKVYDTATLLAVLALYTGLFTLVLIGYAGIFPVVGNPLLKIVAGILEIIIVVALALSVGISYAAYQMPRKVTPRYNVYLRHHRERSAITRQIIRATEELKENLRKKLRKEEEET